MGRISLRERIRGGLFLLDGAMGTELIARGIEAGTCNDYLNINRRIRFLIFTGLIFKLEAMRS